MRTAPKVAIVIVVLAAAGGLVWWQHDRADRAVAELDAQRKATAAMTAVNEAQTTLGDRFSKTAVKVGTTAVFSVSNAGAIVQAELVPLIDDYLGKLDRALMLSTAYLAFHPELPPETRTAFDALVTRAHQFHALRDQLVQLADRAAKGELTGEQLAQQLATAAMALVTGK
jgi:transcriptional regulator with AAA-type ATPase domain